MRAQKAVLIPLLVALSCAGPSRLAEGRRHLATALDLQDDPARWHQVAEASQRAQEAFEQAAGVGGWVSSSVAGAVTARAVADWQAVLEEVNAAETRDPAEQEQLDGRIDQIVRRLRAATGQLPSTCRALANVLFEVNRLEEAAAALDEGLSLWPAEPGLHELARAWSPSHPDPEQLIASLEEGLRLRGSKRRLEPLVRATQGYLAQALARTIFDGGDLAAAAVTYEQAAAAYAAAGAGPEASMDPHELRQRRADSLSMMGWSHFYQALNQDPEGALPRPVLLRLRAAEEAFARALEALPDHEQAVLGLGYVGNHLVQNEALVPAREFFGRAARRFDRADWWNNLAFLCRETGAAAEQAGREVEAERLFERSFRAYSRCIDLTPDNARWVNDTGLMLLYHLQRDLDRAEQLFRRAWELGQDVCENPFVSEESYAENFSAYTDAMLNLARLHRQRDELDAARETIEALLKLAPDRMDAQLLGADIRQALERTTSGKPPTS